MLEQALTAASAHDVRGALVAALEVWRRLPDPRIAFAVGELARHAAGCRPGTPAPVLRPTAWDEMCARRDPVELDALLANVLKGSATIAADRLTALAAWPGDPRLGEAIARWLATPPFTSRSGRVFWDAVLHAIPRTGDPRLAAAVLRAHATFAHAIVTAEVRTSLLARLDRAVRELRDVLPARVELDAAERAACDRLLATCARWEAPTRSREETEAMFLARIRADPDDDGARLVFADWLLDHQDPRGELIALAFARRDGRATKPGLVREQALLRAHRADWIGGLAGALERKTMVFERGFLDAVAISAKRGETSLRRLAGDPAWSTVTAIDLVPPYPAASTSIALLGDAVMGAVRTLRGVTLDVLEGLRAAPIAHRLETLAVTASHGDRDAMAAALAAGAFPSLRHLEWIESISPARVATFLGGAFETVAVRGVSSGVVLRLERVDAAHWHLELVIPAAVTAVPELAAIARAEAARLRGISVRCAETSAAFRAQLADLGATVEAGT